MSIVSLKLTNPRGTADILPDQAVAWESLEKTARHLFKTFGYREIRTPLFEECGLFKRSLGETTEVVNKQLLEVRSQRKDAEGGDESFLALRPEGTAAVVRAYNQYDIGRNEYLSKLFYIGPMFRGERPQKGRLRQFHQIGAEALGRGANNPLLDAEMIAMAVRLLKALGLEGFKLKINSLGTVEDKAGFASWLRTELKDKIGALSDECKAQYERNVFRLLDSKDRDCQQVIASLGIGTKHLSASGLHYFEAVKAALDSMGIVYEVSEKLVRGLDYYTHTVFEIIYEGLGSQDAVGAGGRYNGLIEQLGGGDRRMPEVIGAMGFALGMERVLLALEHQGKNLNAVSALDVFVIAGSPELEARAFAFVNELRLALLSADMDFGKRNFKKQMEQANKVNARFACILGEEEVGSQKVSIKNMKTGEQLTIPAAEAVQWIERQ